MHVVVKCTRHRQLQIFHRLFFCFILCFLFTIGVGVLLKCFIVFLRWHSVPILKGFITISIHHVVYEIFYIYSRLGFAKWEIYVNWNSNNGSPTNFPLAKIQVSNLAIHALVFAVLWFLKVNLWFVHENKS